MVKISFSENVKSDQVDYQISVDAKAQFSAFSWSNHLFRVQNHKFRACENIQIFVIIICCIKIYIFKKLSNIFYFEPIFHGIPCQSNLVKFQKK